MSIQPNIQLAINGYTSGVRNVYLMLSISLALFTFSGTFNTHRKFLQFLAFILICYSMVDGVILSLHFNNHINYFSILNLSEMNKILVKYAKERILLVCTSFILFIIVASIIFFKKIL